MFPKPQQVNVQDEGMRYNGALPDNNLCLQASGESDCRNDTIHIANVVDRGNLNLDPRSQQYSGYLKVGNADRQLFFWMCMSRNDPARDPVVLWLNGGPGCSSLYGALTQWGPKLLDDQGKLKGNPHTLIERAAFIFLEQPIGVGFSWS